MAQFLVDETPRCRSGGGRWLPDHVRARGAARNEPRRGGPGAKLESLISANIAFCADEQTRGLNCCGSLSVRVGRWT